MKKKNYLIIWQVLGWIIFLSLPSVFMPDGPHRPPHEGGWLMQMFIPPRIVNDLFLISVFYFNYYVAIPKYYLTKKYFLFIVCGLLFLVALMIINIPFGHHHPGSGINLIGPPHNIFMFICTYILAMTIRLYQQWQVVAREKLETEVAFLRSQINPHFLFNTLNSIYSLSITKSDEAPKAIVRLSNIMRYSISEASNTKVSLEKEINYIRDYIDLQKLRISDPMVLEVKIEGAFSNYQIAPMILVSIIENAFKYGLNVEENSRIKIVIKVDAGLLNFQVWNKKVYVHQGTEAGSGIGLSNTRQRLILLYPGTHKLNIEDTNHFFKVDLEINLL